VTPAPDKGHSGVAARVKATVVAIAYVAVRALFRRGRERSDTH